MRKIFYLLRRSFLNSIKIFFEEGSLTFVNFFTIILISLTLWSVVYIFYFSESLKDYLQNRLDFSIYFKEGTTREEIKKIQKILYNFPGVKEINLITQEMAFEKLKKESKTNPIIERALTELKSNPLVDYLVVKAENSEVYPKISDYLLKSPYSGKIDYLSYFENKKIIERAISFTNNLKIMILGVVFLVFTFSFFIIFNTLYISFYSLKEEIEILQLLGASNSFIRLPFIFYSLLLSIIGYIFSLGIVVLFLEKTKNFWPNLIPNFSPYYFTLENFFNLNFLILSLIILINTLSSFFILQKYFRL